jgi:uncharacterized OB-fold protein
MTPPTLLNPAAQSAQRSYQDELDRGRFQIQRCSACERHNFPPRELCPDCGSTDLSWLPPGGEGSVYAVTTVRRKPEAGGDYNVSLIELDEQVRMTCPDPRSMCWAQHKRSDSTNIQHKEQ